MDNVAQEVPAFELNILVSEPSSVAARETGVLGYLEALTYEFQREGKTVSCVLIYAQPHPTLPGHFQPLVAADTGFEGIACIDDTARAALLALKVYERAGDRRALALARRWLTFVEYMQYPDGSFANFIRNAAGIRNASGPTSHKGGYWWSVRALWALSAAYRIIGNQRYRMAVERCRLDPIPDGKIHAVLALQELELYAAEPSQQLRTSILEHCDFIAAEANPYFLDHPGTEQVHLWGYHQLYALVSAARALDEPHLLTACRRTIRNLIEPDVKAQFWYSYPDRRKDGVCAYTVTPIVQGLAEMYRATGAKKYRELALQGAAWFYGRNDARTSMYDPTTGMCRDGITASIASTNFGAESSIEAGFAELDRRDLGQL